MLNLKVKCSVCGKNWINGLRELDDEEREIWLCPECKKLSPTTRLVIQGNIRDFGSIAGKSLI